MVRANDEIKTEAWVIEPNPSEAVKSQVIKGRTTKSVGFSVVYPDGETGYIIVGKVTNRKWQPFSDLKQITITWR